ncbi:MAG: DEAD/DEAH box helicase, partial [Candidatus Marinimicrobia bacterium]|nr:DEAD/DEAH box helicase [Candidatus Neomarinimicrobiota bacterium]
MNEVHQKIINDLQTSSNISLEDSFVFTKTTSNLLRSESEEDNEIGRDIIVHVLDNWVKIHEQSQPIWTDLIEACGFYPYLAKEQSKLPLDGLAGNIRKELHQSCHLNGKYLHDEQLRALNIFDSGKNLVISAPTSFGKSLLIEEIVARKTSKNIIIIQPTLALLDETRRNLKKYSDHYKVIIKTSQKYSETGNNIFLLTAERVVEYPEFPPIDVLVIDEFYKLSTYRKDERADILNIAFYKILKQFQPHFYLLGPNIDKVSDGFLKKFSAEFYKTNYSLVSADIVSLFDQYKDKLSKPRSNKVYIENLLFETLIGLKDEQTLIYCSSPERTRELSRKFLAYAKKNESLIKQSLPLIDWAKEHIHPEWSLCECLEFGIGVHDAALPRHLSASVIHQFNRSKIKYLFCTSTIIEG